MAWSRAKLCRYKRDWNRRHQAKRAERYQQWRKENSVPNMRVCVRPKAWREIAWQFLGIPPQALFRPHISDIHRRKCLTSGNSGCN